MSQMVFNLIINIGLLNYYLFSTLTQINVNCIVLLFLEY
jgi:hypothetical protein